MYCLNLQVEEKFEQIRDFVAGKPYVQHLVTPFLAVDCDLVDEKVISDKNYICKYKLYKVSVIL